MKTKNILAVSLIAVMAAGAARADIASTTYVTNRTGNTAEIDVADATDLTTAVNTLNSNLTATAAAAAATKTDLATTNSNVLANTNAIATLNGTGEGSVAEKIETAVSGINTKLEGYATTDDMSKALDSKADKSTIGAVTQGETVVSMIADAKSVGTSASTALATYKSENDLKVTANTNAIEKLDGAVTTDGSVKYQINAAKTDLEGKITAAKTQADKGVEDAKTANDAIAAMELTIQSGDGVIKTVKQTDGKVEVTRGRISNAEVADNAEIAQSKINGLTEALAAKANTADLGSLAKAAPAACSNYTNYCVLTYNGTEYKWEVIGR